MDYHRSSTLVAQRSYTYDALGRPLTRRAARNGQTVNDSFGHNSRSELTSATVNGSTYGYDYDNIGNRNSATEGEEITAYEANNLNQHTAVGDFTPTFDADGNQTLVKTATGIWSVVYNAENCPVRFTNADGSTVIECSYDTHGRRATKKVTTNGSITLHQRYIYRGYLQISACDLTRLGQPCLWLLTWDPSQPIVTRPLAIRKDGTWFAYGWDLTTNICEVFGPAGNIRTAYTYSPYGEVSESGDVTQPIQWSGEYHDSELGLVYFNYRYYNPYSARWISRDPLAETAGLNLYKYTTSPYKVVDVLGSSLVDIAKSVAPHIEGSISSSFTTVFPIAPPAVTVNTTISISGSGCQCCDKATQKNKLLIEIAVSGEGSLGLGTSVDGKKYQPKGRGSKWQDSQTGRFSKKPGGRGEDAGIGTELYGTGDGCCPEETFSGSISVGARASAGGGYGVIIDVNETFALGEEPEFSITASTGFVVGARAEAYVAVSGTISFTVDFSS